MKSMFSLILEDEKLFFFPYSNKNNYHRLDIFKVYFIYIFSPLILIFYYVNISFFAGGLK